MAFGKSQETSTQASVNFKKYYGVGNFFVKGVNPTAKELAEFYNTEAKEEPNYTSMTEVDGENIQSVRIQFLLEYAKKDDNDPIEYKTSVTFFLRNRYKWNSSHTKVQVIDKYGYSGWATKEQVTNHTQLTSSRGDDLRISNDYRPAIDGEVELTDFIKKYLNIPEARTWNKSTNGWIFNPNFLDYSDCECRLDDVKAYFSGNFKEIKTIPTILPKNRIKCLVGMKNTNGKEYAHVYTKMFLSPNATDYTPIQKEVEASKQSGALQNVTFCFDDLREYVVESSTITQNNSSMPFSNTTNDNISMPKTDDDLPF